MSIILYSVLKIMLRTKLYINTVKSCDNTHYSKYYDFRFKIIDSWLPNPENYRQVSCAAMSESFN